MAPIAEDLKTGRVMGSLMKEIVGEVESRFQEELQDPELRDVFEMN